MCYTWRHTSSTLYQIGRVASDHTTRGSELPLACGGAVSCAVGPSPRLEAGPWVGLRLGPTRATGYQATLAVLEEKILAAACPARAPDGLALTRPDAVAFWKGG